MWEQSHFICTHLNLSLGPGLTPQYAFLLKMTAMTRAELVKALKLSCPDNENVSNRCAELSRKAMAEFRMGALCLNPKKIRKRSFTNTNLDKATFTQNQK